MRTVALGTSGLNVSHWLLLGQRERQTDRQRETDTETETERETISVESEPSDSEKMAKTLQKGNF